MPCPICPGCDGPYPGPPRSGITLQSEAAMKADKRYYVNADRSKVVEEGSPEAAYLLAAEGTDIPTEDAKRYGLGRYAPESDEQPPDGPPPDPKAEHKPADGKAKSGPPENKAQQVGETVKSGRDK